MEYINAFPGYEYIPYGDDKKPHNMYRGTDLGFGGYVYAEPGIHRNVALLDIASLHPHSILAMNCFGEYTKNYEDILNARIYIKHGDYDSARKILGGRLAPYLDDESKAKELSQALKIAINSVYGLTSASFDNPFRDVRNKNNTGLCAPRRIFMLSRNGTDTCVYECRHSGCNKGRSVSG